MFLFLSVIALVWRVSQTRVLQGPHRGPISGTTFDNQNPSVSATTSQPVTTNQPMTTSQPDANKIKEEDGEKTVGLVDNLLSRPVGANAGSLPPTSNINVS